MAAQIDLTLEQAVAAVLGCIRPVEETEEAGLLCASGRVAAEDIYAPFANPPLTARRSMAMRCVLLISGRHRLQIRCASA